MDGTVTIYVDVLFFINFIIDFLCLFISGKILCLTVSLPRAAAAAALGGVYSCLAVYLSDIPWYAILLPNAAAAVLMCLTAFGKRKLASSSAVFAVTCALLGGLLCAAYAATGRGWYASGGFYVDADPLLVIVFAACAATVILLYLLLCRKRGTSSDCRAEFIFAGKTFAVRLLADSGCFVRDAMSGDSVIIISGRVLEGTVKCTGADAQTISGLGRTARLVPIRTVSGGKLLAAFRPDSLTLVSDGKKRRIPAVIAVDCDGDSFGGCDGLIPSELL